MASPTTDTAQFMVLMKKMMDLQKETNQRLKNVDEYFDRRNLKRQAIGEGYYILFAR